MKERVYILFFLLLITEVSISQNLILNPSFESNFCDSKTYQGIPNYAFDTIMQNIFTHTTGFDSSVGGLEILFLGDHLPTMPMPLTSDGNYSICMASLISVQTPNYQEGISFKLKEKLFKNHRYKLSFDIWAREGSSYNTFQDYFEIGVSNDSTVFNDVIIKFLPKINQWEYFDTMFVLLNNFKYITFRTSNDKIGTSWTCVDNFRLQRLDSLTDTSSALNEQLLQTLEVHPNPFNEQFTVQTKGLSSSIINIKLYDIYGKEVLNQRPPLHQNGAIINCSALSRGIYFIELLSEQDGKEKTIGRSKIIKK